MKNLNLVSASKSNSNSASFGLITLVVLIVFVQRQGVAQSSEQQQLLTNENNYKHSYIDTFMES